MGLRLNKRKIETGNKNLREESFVVGRVVENQSFIVSGESFSCYKLSQTPREPPKPYEPNLFSRFSLWYLTCSWDLWSEMSSYSHKKMCNILFHMRMFSY